MPGRTFVPLYVNAYENRRVIAAARHLTGGDVEKMVGHLGRLWGWALDNAESGDLSHVPAKRIVQILNFRLPTKRSDSAAEALVSRLKDAGLLTSDGLIHDWNDYAGLLLERRERDRKRKRREREKKRHEEDEKERQDAPRPQSPPLSRGQSAPAKAAGLSMVGERHAERPRPPAPVSRGTSAPGPNATERTETGPDRIDNPLPPSGGTDAADRAVTVTGTLAEVEHLRGRVAGTIERADEPWATALQALASEVPTANFLTWFEHATFSEVVHDGDQDDQGRRAERTVWVRNGFEQSWVTEHYRGKLKEAVELVSGVPGSLVIEVGGDGRGEGESIVPVAPSRGPRNEGSR